MIRIVPFVEDRAEAWDAFVAESRNGTFFHTRQFLSYHPPERFTDVSLLFFDEDRLAGLLPAARIKEGGKTFLVSHPGASYGGLVLAASAGVILTGQIVDVLIAWVREQEYAGVRMLRLTPPTLCRHASDDQGYWLYQRGASLTRFEMDGSLSLRGLREEDVLSTLTGKCRNMVRQAERHGITVRFSDDVAAFWPTLESTLHGRYGAKPTHTLEEMQRLTVLAPDAVRLCAAYEGGTMIAGIIVMTIHEKALYTLYMAQDYHHQQSHPIHLILVELMRAAIQEGRDILHLGVSTEDGGGKVNEGLFFFKESFGMKPVRRESWELTL